MASGRSTTGPALLARFDEREMKLYDDWACRLS